MKIAIFQHVPSEPSGYFETFFGEQQIPFDYIQLYDTNEIPRHLSAAHLHFMG